MLKKLVRHSITSLIIQINFLVTSSMTVYKTLLLDYYHLKNAVMDQSFRLIISNEVNVHSV